MADSFEKLSGSVDGKPVKVTAVAIAAGNTVHAAHATDLDLITLYAHNNDPNETRTLTVGWGGVTADETFTVPIPPAAGPVPITDRLPLTNSLIVKVAADEADDVFITGMVTRIDK